MKLHKYVTTEVEHSPGWLGGLWWRYNITACGLRRQSADFHLDGAKTNDEITCKKCRKYLQLDIK